MLLFHLSIDDKLIKLTPRVPYRIWNEHEDNYVERICFSDSINGCLSALYADEGQTYNIYVPTSKIKVYHPNDKDVVDQEFTHEVWAIDETNVIKVGKIIVKSSKCIETHLKQEIHIPESKFQWEFIKAVYSYALP